MYREPFWLVWCPTGSAPPSRRHHSVRAAQEEAERLARLAPGQDFYVVQPVSVSRKIEVVTTPLCPAGAIRAPDDGIPF